MGTIWPSESVSTSQPKWNARGSNWRIAGTGHTDVPVLLFPSTISVNWPAMWRNYLRPEFLTPSDSTLSRDYRLLWLADFCAFRNEIQVSSFLRTHAYLIDIIFEAIAHVTTTFPTEVTLELEIFVDPEAEDRPQLFLLVGDFYNADRTVQLLEKLYDEWWLDAMPRARGKMTIGLA